jgi:NTE family protein
VAHIGVLRVLEQNRIPIHGVAGTSAGSVIAAAVAGGATTDCLIRQARGVRFRDFAGWTISRMGFASNDRMAQFLARAFPQSRFERLKLPLAIAATDLLSGEPVIFRHGDLIEAVRASCAYPGLFLPVKVNGRTLVDGTFSYPIPTAPLRQMGVTRIIAVHVGGPHPLKLPENVFQVVNQCFALMQQRIGADWRRQADIVIEPDLKDFDWSDFSQVDRLIAAGEAAARAALPAIRRLLEPAPATPRRPELAPA